MKTMFILFLTLMSGLSFADDQVGDTTALSKFSSFFSAKKTETSETEIVTFGKLQLTIRKEENIYKVGYIYNSEYKFLFETTSLKMISQFKGQDAQLKNVNRVNIAVKGYLVNPTSWFVMQDDKSYHFLRKKGSEIISFAIPNNGSVAHQISTYTFTSAGSGGWYTLFSYKEKNGEQGTLILRESDAVISHVSQQYNDLIKLSSTQQPERNFVLDEKTGQFNLPDGNSFNVGNINSQKHQRIRMTMAEGVNLQSLLQPLNITSVKTTQEVHNTLTSTADRQVESATPVAAKSETNFANVNITINYKNESYQIYNSNVKSTSGIFLRRLKDGMIVKISTLSQVPELSGKQLGFSVTDDGILEHNGIIRKIDLHAFEEESKIIPLDANADNVKWVEESFDDFKEMSSKKNLTVVESRKTIVDKISDQILSGDQTTVILVGEGTDKEDILSEVSKRVPRTWKVLDLDPSRFGSISYSGELQDKVKKLVSASRSTPILWIANNFNNFQGFGATQGSTTDLLNLLSRELSSSANSLFKLVGTCFNTDILYESVKNPAVLSALEKEQIDILNAHEVKNYLKEWLNKKYPELQVSDAFYNKLTQSAARIKPVDAEPKRSLSLLEGIARKLKKSNQLKSDYFTEAEVDAALTYVYGIDSGLVTLQGRSKKMKDFLINLGKTVVGHDHIKYEVHSASEIGLAGLHDGRGPMASHYVDGPPGVGKTELAKGVAKSLGVPFVRIQMDQFKVGSGLGIIELKSQIAAGLKKNPFSVILLDELEKSDPKVLEGLLDVMDNEKFVYYEKDASGKNKTNYESPINATFILTSNGLGEQILNWFYQNYEKDAAFDNLSAEQFNSKFLSEYPKEKLIEHLVNVTGLPRPLLDRIQYVHMGFPPGHDAMTSLLKLKLSESKELINKSMGIKFNLKNVISLNGQSKIMNEGEILDSYIKESRQKRMSVREILKKFDRDIKSTAARLQMSGGAENGKYYLFDINQKTTIFQPTCSGVFGGGL